eukprot:TCONS_00017041-protein
MVKKNNKQQLAKQNNKKSNVKSRLGIKNNPNLGKFNKSKTTTKAIIKKIENGGPGSKKELKLFTKHFDARSKIKPKQSDTRSHKQGGRNDGGNLTKKNNQKTKSDVRAKQQQQQQQQQKQKDKKNTKKHSTTVQQNSDRLSTFTGKSIHIVAKNDLIPKARETHVKGKMLSVTATNSKTRKQRRSPQKQKQKQDSILSKSFKLRTTRQAMEEPEDYITPSSILSKQQQHQNSLPAKIVISNLHQNVTHDDIKELFGAVGALREARLKNLGTAEVVYESAEDAFAAYNKYNTRNLDGQPMILKITTVQEAPEPQPMPSQSSRSSMPYYENRPSQIYSSGGVNGGATPLNKRFNSGASYTSNAPAAKPVVFTVRL